MNSAVRVLIQGIGNPIRGDDGLGPRFVEIFLENTKRPEVDCEWVYQLQIEQAEQWSHYSHVLIVDAHANQELPFKLEQVSDISAADSLGHVVVASHEVSPAAIAGLSKEVFDFRGEVFVLSLRGICFLLGAPLSVEAEQSLATGLRQAEEFVNSFFLRAESVSQSTYLDRPDSV